MKKEIDIKYGIYWLCKNGYNVRDIIGTKVIIARVDKDMDCIYLYHNKPIINCNPIVTYNGSKLIADYEKYTFLMSHSEDMREVIKNFDL